jgi:phage/plasmid-like protein (TIGR03299 family)
MAHELTSSDGLVLVEKRAWHNLGVVVQDAPSPTESIRIIKADWLVKQRPVFALMPGGSYREIDSHVMNYRDDTWEELGLVGTDWQAWQNHEVAEFAEQLAKNGNTVKIETAGTIRGGKKIWFLLRGQSFSVRNSEDEVIPYILVSNGHDGKTGLRCDNTTIRVVCANTLHMVIPDGRTGRVTESGFSCSHVGDLKSKIEEARKALRLYEFALDKQITLYNELANRGVTSDLVKQFFLQVYSQGVHPIKAEPKTAEEQHQYERAVAFVAKCNQKFEESQPRFGANIWTMVNAFTETSQHARVSQSARESALLFGVDTKRGLRAVQVALALAS